MEEGCGSEMLQLLWVDQGYTGEKFARALCASVRDATRTQRSTERSRRSQRFAIASLCGAKVEVVKRSEAGFQVLPRRWVVERTLGWLGR